MKIEQSEKLKKTLEVHFKKRTPQVTINPNSTLTVSDVTDFFSWEILALAHIGEKLGFGMEVRGSFHIRGKIELFYSDHYLTLKYENYKSN